MTLPVLHFALGRISEQELCSAEESEKGRGRQGLRVCLWRGKGRVQSSVGKEGAENKGRALREYVRGRDACKIVGYERKEKGEGKVQTKLWGIRGRMKGGTTIGVVGYEGKQEWRDNLGDNEGEGRSYQGQSIKEEIASST